MAKANNWNDDILKQYLDAGEDFGFSAVNQDELNGLMKPQANPEIDAIKNKLDQINENMFPMLKRILK